jgi:hypothetical protein
MPNPISGSIPGLPPLPAQILPQASTTDGAQKLDVDRNVIRISGDAAGSSKAQLSFEGQNISVDLSAGMRAFDTFKALQAKVPPGYELRTLQEVRGTVMAEIISRTRVELPGNVPQSPPPRPGPDNFTPPSGRPSGLPPAGLPPLPTAVRPAVSSNDPTQHVSIDPGNNYVRIAGVASNNGIATSALTLEIEGVKLSVPQGAGSTPYQTFQELAKQVEEKLPKGWRANLLHQDTHANADVLFELLKPPGSQPKNGDWLG